MKFDMPAGARHILTTLTAAGHEAYLVGGCVRDLLRGVVPHDWDICTSARPEQTRACFPDRRLVETGLKHGTVTVLMKDGAYEVTTFRVDGPYTDGRRPDSVRFVSSLTEDLSRRDFTMNAAAIGLDGVLQDPFGGQEDIRAGRVRCVGDPNRRFREDGLRVMRALRFAAGLDCTVEAHTAAAVHGLRDMLRHVAAERINVELGKLLTGPGVGRVLREYPDVLCVFWPELGPLAELEQHNPWHCWDGWEHTIRALEAAPPTLVLRLTMLLHDIGKPAVKTTDAGGVDHFYGHPAVSASLAEGMLRRLKFDSGTTAKVTALVRTHDVPVEPVPRSIRRLLNKFGPEDFRLLLAVHRADSMGQNPDQARDRLVRLDRAEALAEEILAAGECFRLRDLAVSGRDVLAAGAVPGPQVGAVLNALLERVMDERLPNRREVLLREMETLLPQMRREQEIGK